MSHWKAMSFRYIGSMFLLSAIMRSWHHSCYTHHGARCSQQCGCITRRNEAMNDRALMKYLPFAFAGILAVFGITQLLRRQRKPRSFREDPIGALKDRGEIVAGKAQEASEEALVRLQATLDDIRDRLPDVNSKSIRRGRKQVNKRI